MTDLGVRIQLEERSRAVVDIRSALEAALSAADPERITYRRLHVRTGVLRVGERRYDLGRFGRILVLGAGKASARMALGVERRMKGITGGIVVAPEGQPKPRCRRITILDAPHPLPGKKAEDATRRLLSLVGRPLADDFVLCLFSGGGSALMELPDSGIPLGDLRKATRLLLESGADIHEINTVRKHLSQVKGGRLAQLLYPATILTLVMSDVVGNEPDSIASGPTVPDRTTYLEARKVLEGRGVWRRAPETVRGAIEDGVSGLKAETPKPDSRFFSKTGLVVVGDNALCCRAAADELRRRGYHTKTIPTSITGEARDVGKAFATKLIKLSGGRFRPEALVGGGETTVTVMGKGRGGRNQELALAAALALRGRRHLWVASMGTDGVDGASDAAGALAGWRTIGRSVKVGVDPAKSLEDNDSHGFFKAVGGLIITGPTGTNLNDVLIGISEGPQAFGSNMI